MFGPLEAVRGAHHPAVFPKTRIPLRARRKSWQGQKLMNPWWLLTAISQQSTSHSGEIGSLLSPIKVHILCPQIPVNGMSVLRECVCLRVSKKAWWRSRRSGERASREMVLVTGPRLLDVFFQLLHQARIQTIGEHVGKTMSWHTAKLFWWISAQERRNHTWWDFSVAVLETSRAFQYLDFSGRF